MRVVVQTDAMFNSAPPVFSLANQYCQSKGLELESSPVNTRAGSTEAEKLQWRFYCKKPYIPLIEQPVINTNSTQNNINDSGAVNIDVSKVKCQELGFETGTEAFGKCVLKLSK
jgi:hypothetical protein